MLQAFLLSMKKALILNLYETFATNSVRDINLLIENSVFSE